MNAGQPQAVAEPRERQKAVHAAVLHVKGGSTLSSRLQSGFAQFSQRKPCSVQAAVLGVPFVDVISTMSDPALPATVTEYEVTPIFDLSNQESVSSLLQPIVQKHAIHPSQHKVLHLPTSAREIFPIMAACCM